MWRFYAELFLLMVMAFAVGSIVAAIGVRLVVRSKAPVEAAPVAAPAAAAAEPVKDGGTA